MKFTTAYRILALFLTIGTSINAQNLKATAKKLRALTAEKNGNDDKKMSKSAIHTDAVEVEELVLELVDEGNHGYYDILDTLYAKGFDGTRLRAIFETDAELERSERIKAALETVPVERGNEKKDAKAGPVEEDDSEPEKKKQNKNNSEAERVGKLIVDLANDDLTEEEIFEALEDAGFSMELLIEIFGSEAMAKLEVKLAMTDADVKESGHSRRMLQEACELPEDVNLDGTIGETIMALQDLMKKQKVTEDFLKNMGGATTYKAREVLLDNFFAAPASRIISCLAAQTQTTIAMDFGISGAVTGVVFEVATNLVWGEGGQHAASISTGAGLTNGLLGAGVSSGLSFSRKQLGAGWETVGKAMHEPDKCLSIGWAPKFIGASANLQFSPEKVDVPGFIAKVEKAFNMTKGEFPERDPSGLAVERFALKKAEEAEKTIFKDFPITSFGVSIYGGVDLLDEVLDLGVVGYFLPDVTETDCAETLVYCKGEGCDKKNTADIYEDGTVCVPLVSCNLCRNTAELWYNEPSPGINPAMTCGKEPK